MEYKNTQTPLAQRCHNSVQELCGGWPGGLISFGLHEGKVVEIIDVIDQKRPLVDGPCTQVRSQALPLKSIQLTDFKGPHDASHKCV